jgi:hypothetical protein
MFGTLDLSDAIDEYSEAVDTRLNSMQVPKRHGVLISEVPVLNGRVIRCKGRIQAVDYTVLRGTMDTIGRLLNSGRQKLRIVDDRYIWAYKQSFAYAFVPGAALCAADFSIDFLCDDPFWYEEETTTETFVLADTDTPVGGGNYLKEINLTNGGEVFVYINVQVDADQGYDVDKVLVRNKSQEDRTFQYTGTILQGKSLVVDSNQFTSKNDGVDDLTNWAGYWIALDKCTATFELEGKPATYTFSWQQRYF